MAGGGGGEAAEELCLTDAIKMGINSTEYTAVKQVLSPGAPLQRELRPGSLHHKSFIYLVIGANT